MQPLAKEVKVVNFFIMLIQIKATILLFNRLLLFSKQLIAFNIYHIYISTWIVDIFHKYKFESII